MSYASKQNQKSNILKSVLTVTGFSVLTRALSFLFKIYLSRSLGAEAMGLFQMANTVFFLFIALSTGGISTVLSRKIAEANAVDARDNGARLLSTSLVMGMGASLVLLALAYIALPYMGFIITDERAVPLLKIMLPALVSTTFYIIIRGWFWGNKHFFDFSLSETIEEILRILFTLLFVSGLVSGINGQTGLAIAFTVSDFIVMGVIVFMFIRRGGKFSACSSFGEILKPAAPLTVMKIFGSLAGTAVALIIPSGLMAGGMSLGEATASVGRISGMANPLLFAPNAIISSLAIVLIPELSEANAKKDTAALGAQISKGIGISLIVSGGFMVVYAALGSELTSFLYADIPSGEYLQKASVLLLFMPINHIASSSMNSIGLEKENFITYSVGAVLMLIASVVLPKYVGEDAVIIADALFMGVTVSGNVYFLRKHIKGGLGILKPLLSVAVFAVPCIMLGNNLYALCSRINAVFALVIAGGACFFAYLTLACVMGLINPRELLKSGIKARA